MKAIKVNNFLVPVLAVVALLGSVWIAKAAGAWQTSGRGQVLLDAGGQPDPAGIKGWMTLIEISETYGVPLDVVYAMIGGVQGIPAETALKDLEGLLPGMEVSALRAGVAAYLEGTAGDGEAAPEKAADPPRPEPSPTPETIQEVLPQETKDHIPQGAGDGSGSDLGLPEDGSPLPGSQIKGRMTLQEVVDLCQVPLDYLTVELGLPKDVDAQLRMRDLANQLGIEVLTVREVVDRYQAEH